MRILPLTILGLLALAPAATAQEDGCLQSNPCLIDVEVDESGIASVSITTLTAGDWFVLSVSNLDGQPHTVAFATVEVPVEAYGYRDSEAFAARSAGTYQITDQPTGDSAPVTVVSGDAVDAENGVTASSSSSSSGAPALPVALVAVALAGMAALRRRD